MGFGPGLVPRAVVLAQHIRPIKPLRGTPCVGPDADMKKTSWDNRRRYNPCLATHQIIPANEINGSLYNLELSLTSLWIMKP